MSESLRIVIPSRHRPDNAVKIARLLPDATVFVHESERLSYEASGTPLEISTTSKSGIGPVRSAILDTFDEDCIVMIDDDLKGIVPMLARKQKRITDPATIRQVIQNSHNVAMDLDIGIFGWSITPNPIGKDFEGTPIRLVSPIASSYGIRGKARERRFDESLTLAEDVDFVYQALLHDRITLHDMRWFFDHGPLLGGAGGNSGNLTDARADQCDATVRARWGRWIGDASSGNGPRSGTKFKRTLSVRCPRRNPSAVRL